MASCAPLPLAGLLLKAAVPDRGAGEELVGALRKHRGSKNDNWSPDGWNNFSKRCRHWRAIPAALPSNRMDVMCSLPFAVCRLPFAVCRLPFTRAEAQ